MGIRNYDGISMFNYDTPTKQLLFGLLGLMNFFVYLEYFFLFKTHWKENLDGQKEIRVVIVVLNFLSQQENIIAGNFLNNILIYGNAKLSLFLDIVGELCVQSVRKRQCQF